MWLIGHAWVPTEPVPDVQVYGVRYREPARAGGPVVGRGAGGAPAA